MTCETVLTDLTDGILTITMNRPDRLNAWTCQMGDDLQNAIQSANDDDDVEAIVLTGTVRGFCTGADVKDLLKEKAEPLSRNENRTSRAPGKNQARYLPRTASRGL